MYVQKINKKCAEDKDNKKKWLPIPPAYFGHEQYALIFTTVTTKWCLAT